MRSKTNKIDMSRESLLQRIVKTAGLSDGKTTTAYFTKKQLVELLTILQVQQELIDNMKKR